MNGAVYSNLSLCFFLGFVIGRLLVTFEKNAHGRYPDTWNDHRKSESLYFVVICRIGELHESD